MTVTAATVATLPAGALVARKALFTSITAGTRQLFASAVSGARVRVLQAYIQSNGGGDAILASGTSGAVLLRVPAGYPGVTLDYNPLGWCDTAAGEGLYVDASANNSIRFGIVMARLGTDTAFGEPTIAPTPPGAERRRLEIDDTLGAAWQTLRSAVSGRVIRVEGGRLTMKANAGSLDIGNQNDIPGRSLRSWPLISGWASLLELPPSPYGWAESTVGGALEIRSHVTGALKGHLNLAIF